jgi:hypothetical protein
LEIDLGIPYQATIAEQFLKVVYDVQIDDSLYFTEDIGQPVRRNLIVMHRPAHQLPSSVVFRIRALEDCEEGWGWQEAATLLINGMQNSAGNPAFGSFTVSSNVTCQKVICSAAVPSEIGGSETAISVTRVGRSPRKQDAVLPASVSPPLPSPLAAAD